jgi:hypothetical protein
LSGYYDQNNVWHYNKTCIYDDYYNEGCSNLEGEYDEDGVWYYDDPCSLDDDEDDDDDDYDDDDIIVKVNTPLETHAAGNSTLVVAA